MKIETIRLKPAEGARVRHKGGRLFESEGESVPASSYYLRLLDAGDLVECSAAKRKPKKTDDTKGSTS